MKPSYGQCKSNEGILSLRKLAKVLRERPVVGFKENWGAGLATMKLESYSQLC